MATTKNIIMKQFNGTDYDTLYPKTVYNQVSGVAPDGYGLGKETTTYILDANTATEAGWYYWGKDTVNTPSNYGAMLVIPRFSNITTQLAFLDVGGFTASQICVRKQMDGVWGEWEWVNPPMELGVEYRTTERYLGKPVYAKAVSGGAITPDSKKAISMSTVGESIVDTCVAAKLSNGTEIRLPYTDSSGGTSGEVFSSVQSGIVSVAFTLHGINATESTVIAKYTKTTD